MADLNHDPCPTCGRTYGEPVGDPNRCGGCLTGLSFDGRAVFPVQRNGRWVSPITGAEVVQLPDGTWTVAMRETTAALGLDFDESIARVAADRARGIW